MKKDKKRKQQPPQMVPTSAEITPDGRFYVYCGNAIISSGVCTQSKMTVADALKQMLKE